MSRELLVYLGAGYALIFAVFHLTFWKLFKWPEDLVSISFINRNVIQILNLCLTFVFFAIAYICIFHVHELIETELGNVILILTAIFCFLRALEQVYFFGLKNKISLAFFLVFLLGACLYFAPTLI